MEGLAPQQSRPDLLLPAQSPETLLVSWVKTLFHEWPDLVTKLASNNFFTQGTFFGEMLHRSFVSYRFLFLAYQVQLTYVR